MVEKEKPEDSEGITESAVKIGGVAMGLLEEILKNKEEILVSFLNVLEGKETRAKVNLDGIEFHVGKSAIKLNGEVEFTFIPLEERKK